MSLFNYSQYKPYLRDRIRLMPKNGRGQVLAFANALSIHPTLVSQILRGSKDFTLEQAHSLCEYLGMVGLEADYFLTLVQIERSGTAKLKNYYKQKLAKMKQESLSLAKRVTRDRDLTEEEKA